MAETHFDADAELEALADRIEGERDAFAARYFVARLRPFCERYRLRFSQGMGAHSFESSAGHVFGSFVDGWPRPGSEFAAELDRIEGELCDPMGAGGGRALSDHVDECDARRPCLGRARDAVESTAEPIERAAAAARLAARFADCESNAARGHALRSAEAAERAAAHGRAAAEAFEAARAVVCALRMAEAQRIIADGYRAHALADIDAARNAASECKRAARDAGDHARSAERLGETPAEAEARKRAAVVADSIRAAEARETRLKG